RVRALAVFADGGGVFGSCGALSRRSPVSQPHRYAAFSVRRRGVQVLRGAASGGRANAAHGAVSTIGADGESVDRSAEVSRYASAERLSTYARCVSREMPQGRAAASNAALAFLWRRRLQLPASGHLR